MMFEMIESSKQLWKNLNTAVFFHMKMQQGDVHSASSLSGPVNQVLFLLIYEM